VPLNDSSRPPGHNHSDSLKNDRPVSFKRLLDGAPFSDARARRAPHGSRARFNFGSCFWAATALMGEARRGTPIARPWGGGARRTDLPSGAGGLGAPRIHGTKKKYVRMPAGWERAA
jgi:hypothetical protein